MASRSATILAYNLIPSPNGINFLPKSPRSLSPLNKLQNPHVIGIEFAIPIMAFAANVDDIIEPVSIPDTASA